MKKQEHLTQEPSKYRYPGTQPFSIEQSQIFFGRKKDIQDLFDLLSLENLVILHSQSGLGKSSLINAGILPRVTAQNSMIPFSIRFGGYKEKQTAKPIDIFLQQIASNNTKKTTSYLDKIIPKDNSIWYHLKNKQLNLEDQQKGFLLVFDQFEELFTYPEKDVRKFGTAIKEIVSNQIPQRFGQALKEKKMDEFMLSDEEKDSFYKKLNVKILFAIRSDRMSLLSGLKDYLPNILRHCQELLPLNVDQAEEALLQPAYKIETNFMCSPFDYEDDFLDEILLFLTKNYSKTLNNSAQVDSFGLQILCQNIEKKVIKKEIRKVSKTDIGDIASIYNNHYNDLIQDIGTKEEQIKVRRLIEEGLIFEKDKIRLRLYEQVILSDYDISETLLKRLLDTHLLRAEENSEQGGRTYELSHDSFINPILNAKKERIEKERIQQLKEEQKQQAKIELEKLNEAQGKFKKELELEAEKKLSREARKKRNWAITLGSIATTLAAILFFITVELLKNNRELKTALYDGSMMATTISIKSDSLKKQINTTDSLYNLSKGKFTVISRQRDSIKEILEIMKLQKDSLENTTKDLTESKNNIENLINEYSQKLTSTEKSPTRNLDHTKSDKEVIFELNKGLNYVNWGLISSRKIKTRTSYKKANIDFKSAKDNFNKADSVFNMYKNNPLSKEYYIRLSEGYGSLSYNLLFIKKYAESEKAAKKGLKIDESISWIKTNLAHAILLQGRYTEAERIYEKIKDIPYQDAIFNTLGKASLDDINQLERKGLIPQRHITSVERIKMMLK